MDLCQPSFVALIFAASFMLNKGLLVASSAVAWIAPECQRFKIVARLHRASFAIERVLNRVGGVSVVKYLMAIIYGASVSSSRANVGMLRESIP
ncbi:MAG: dihydrodipicolinate synthase/N-acetylneuraminate lyase [Bacteroidia bacterium]